MENVHAKDHLLALAMQGIKPGARPAGGKNVEKWRDMLSAVLDEDRTAMRPVDKPVDKKPVDKKPTDKPADKPAEETAETKPVPQQEDAPVTDAQVEQQMLLAAMTVVVTPATVAAEPETVEPELQIVTAATESDLVEQTAVKPQTASVEAPVIAQETEAVEAKPILKAVEPETELQPVEHQKMEAPKEGMELEDMDMSVKAEGSMEAAEQPLFEEVETVPIKVGEAPKEELTDAVPVHDQLKGRLEEAIRGGESRLELELEPRSLGRVVIEMTMQKDGTMHVLLRAEKPSTQLLLDSDAGKLQGILGRDTRQEVYVENVNLHEEKQMPQYRQEPQDQGRERQQQQERQPRKHEEGGEDFMHQLRLGLTPVHID